MANAYSFCVSFWRICRGVLPQVTIAFLLAGMAEAQPTLAFRTTQVPSDSGILQVLTADFNGDGNQDTVFLQVFRLTVVLGNGDGTFQPPIHMPVTGNFQYSSMAVGDFNNDGKVDVVVLGLAGPYVGGTPFVQTYLGQGDGTFALPISSPSSAFVGNFPIVGDVNHDGNLDLIGRGAIALGSGDGTFQPDMTPSTCPSLAAFGIPYPTISDFTVADFRRSGNLDWSFIAIQVLGGAIFDPWNAMGIVCFGNGDATFASGPIIYSEGGVAVDRSSVPSIQMTTGDFNGDGKADVLVSTVSFPQGLYSGEPISFAYETILGNGDGTFQKPARKCNRPIIGDSAELPSETRRSRYERRRQIRPRSNRRQPRSRCPPFKRRWNLQPGSRDFSRAGYSICRSGGFQ